MIEHIVTRPLDWVVRKVGARTLLSLALLVVALSSVALGLAKLIRGLDPVPALAVALSGVFLGWILAVSPLPGWMAGVLAFILGAEEILVYVGRLAEPLANLARALIQLAREVLVWPFEGSRLGLETVAPSLNELGTGIEALMVRLRDWMQAMVGGQAAFDPIAAALAWSLVLWLAAVWAGWTVRRSYRPLQAVAPAGALLAVGLSYTWDQPIALWFVLSATLLLLVLTGHVARERRWQMAGIDYSPEIRIELAGVAVLLSIGLTAMAILAPSISIRPIVNVAHRLAVEHFSVGKQVADSMGLEPLAGEGVGLDRLRAAGLPNRTLIGSGPELSEQTVMVIHPEGQLPAIDGRASAQDVPPRYYWRALTYDEYTGRGWNTAQTETREYRAGEPAVSSNGSGRLVAGETSQRPLRQEIQMVGNPGGVLYRAGELVTADQDYRVAWRSPGDAFGAEIDASVYRVDSLVAVVGEAQLRSSEGDYPSWVQNRYLVVPSDVPDRVHALALDLTATEPTPYDQARAIESYLRAFTYTLDLPAPPPNREIADYFLFDLRQGYCDYYATTMAVMARSIGLPARLVSGYASGRYDTDKAQYVVSAADAHSWVEIYFPQYGWIEFEPTGGRPPIERPAETIASELPEYSTPLEPRFRRRLGLGEFFWLGVLGVLASLALGSLSWWVLDGWRLRRLGPAMTVAALYQRLLRHGRRLGVSEEPGDTPHEFAAGLTGYITKLARERRSDVDLKSVRQQVFGLTGLYVQGQYSPRKPDADEQDRAIGLWRRLRRDLWRAWLWQKTKR